MPSHCACCVRDAEMLLLLSGVGVVNQGSSVLSLVVPFSLYQVKLGKIGAQH